MYRGGRNVTSYPGILTRIQNNSVNRVMEKQVGRKVWQGPIFMVMAYTVFLAVLFNMNGLYTNSILLLPVIVLSTWISWYARAHAYNHDKVRGIVSKLCVRNLRYLDCIFALSNTAVITIYHNSDKWATYTPSCTSFNEGNSFSFFSLCLSFCLSFYLNNYAMHTWRYTNDNRKKYKTAIMQWNNSHWTLIALCVSDLALRSGVVFNNAINESEYCSSR